MPLFRSRPELLSRFRQGDRAAMEEVYLAYVERVEQLVRKGFYLAHKGIHVDGARPHEIGDLVQEAFTRAFTERARLAYDGLRDYGPFLATLVRNLLVDWARKGGREISQVDLGELDDGTRTDATDADEPAWADAETLRVVEAYLAALPPQLRVVHEARYVKNASQEAAAAELGITRQQLRTREGKLRDGLALALKKAGLAF